MPAFAGMTAEDEEREVHSIELKLSAEGTKLSLSLAATSADLSASDIDRLIRDLAAARARMTPVVPAEPPADPAKLHQSDNLLWSVKAAPERTAVQFASHHPGLGWSSMWLSRAQVEDLITSFEFELVKVPQVR